MQAAALLLTGALLGALGTATLSDKERSSDRTATVYSTAGAESWEYSGKARTPTSSAIATLQGQGIRFTPSAIS